MHPGEKGWKRGAESAVCDDVCSTRDVFGAHNAGQLTVDASDDSKNRLQRLTLRRHAVISACGGVPP